MTKLIKKIISYLFKNVKKIIKEPKSHMKIATICLFLGTFIITFLGSTIIPQAMSDKKTKTEIKPFSNLEILKKMEEDPFIKSEKKRRKDEELRRIEELRIIKENQIKKEQEEREAQRLAQIENERIAFITNRGGNPDYRGTISERALQQAKEFLGLPYVWGAVGPKTFDCSGLVQYSYKLQGKDISRTTYTQVHEGENIRKKDIQPGDLIFFSIKDIDDHVGIYNGDGTMVQAPQTGDVVKISSVPWNKVYKIKRIT